MIRNKLSRAANNPGRQRAVHTTETLEVRLALAANTTTILNNGDADYQEWVGSAQLSNLTNVAGDQLSAHAIADSSGNMYNVYADAGVIKLMTRTVGASAWGAAETVGGAAASAPRIARDSATGTLHIVYQQGSEIFYTKKAPAGSWTSPLQLSLAVNNSITPAIDSTASGDLHVVWNDAASGNQQIVYREFTGGAWQSEVTLSTSSGVDVNPRVAVGTDNQVHVVWNNTTNNELYYVNRVGGVWQAAVRLDDTAARSYIPDIVIDSSNNPHVSWHDNEGGWDVAYSKRIGGVWSAIQRVGSPALVEGNTAIAIGPDGQIRISYMDYHSIWLVKHNGTSFSTPQLIIPEAEATFSTVVVNPVNNRTYVIAQAAKAGVTNAGSSDLIEYSEGSSIVSRKVFYNNSAWDGNSAAAAAADDSAIATDKNALLPGQAATYANYTDYNKGLNGIIIDIAGLPSTPTLADFAFKSGTDANPANWTTIPVASGFLVRPGAGVGGSTRVHITFADSSIVKQWLRVTVLATARTGLASDDVFYFGNVTGDVGNVAGNSVADATDEFLIRSNPRNLLNPAPVNFQYDVNRDKKVDAADEFLVRSNTTNTLTDLNWLTAPAATTAWSTVNSGYGGTYRTTTGSGSNLIADVAGWTKALAAGLYTFEFTWTSNVANATAVPIFLLDAGNFFTSLTENQTITPLGTSAGGFVFKVEATFSVTGGYVNIRINDRVTGLVSVDAVRITPAPANVTNLSTGSRAVFPDITSDAAGNMHAVYSGGVDNSLHVQYITKAAGSTTWSAPLSLGGSNTGTARIAVQSNGDLHVVYHESDNVYYRRRTAGVWGAAVQLSDGTKSLEPDVAVDSLGNVSVVWHCNQGINNYDIFYRKFDVGTGTWLAQVNLSNDSNLDGYPRVAIGTDNVVQVVWHVDRTSSNDDDVRYIKSVGAGWSAPTTVDTTATRSYNPSIALKPGSNLPVVAWQENPANNWEVRVSEFDGTNWGASVSFNANLTDGIGEGSTGIAISPSGVIALVWNDFSDFFIVRKDGAGGTWSPIRKIVDLAGAGEAAAIEADPVSGEFHLLGQAKPSVDHWDLVYHFE